MLSLKIYLNSVYNFSIFIALIGYQMTGLFRAYESEIFSFRRKDNKGNSRVSEFCEALKIGITSEFKDGISICYAVYQRSVSSETHVSNAIHEREN
jgi:hypothetical protein